MSNYSYLAIDRSPPQDLIAVTELSPPFKQTFPDKEYKNGDSYAI